MSLDYRFLSLIYSDAFFVVCNCPRKKLGNIISFAFAPAEKSKIKRQKEKGWLFSSLILFIYKTIKDEKLRN